VSPGPAAARRTLRYRAVRALRQRARASGDYDRYARLIDVIGEHRPWWDWGHRLMALSGTYRGGSSEPPRARDLYMRVGWARREDNHHAIEGSENERVETTHAMTAWEGVKRGEEWRTFDWQDDGHTLRVGWLNDEGRITDSAIGASQGEMARFRRWFIWESWVKASWCGLRPWLYYRGLHAAVEERRPLTCQLTPPRGSGGYSHWHCGIRRPLLAILLGRRQQHPGPHRFKNYTWTEGEERVAYERTDDPLVWDGRRAPTSEPS